MKNNKVCPMERAGGLDLSIRKWFQNPDKILRPFVKEGMVAVDYGCGPGFFALGLADLIGNSGRVFAVDLQRGMLDLVKIKVDKTNFSDRIILHQCQTDRTNLTGPVDFILVFYVIHEVPNQSQLFKEFHSLLSPQGKALVVEPPIHVSKADFQESLDISRSCGFEVESGPNIFLSKTAVLKKI